MPDRLATSAGVVPQQRASLWQVIRDQRKTIVVGLVLAVASFWILGQLDEWRLATSLAIGVGPRPASTTWPPSGGCSACSPAAASRPRRP